MEHELMAVRKAVQEQLSFTAPAEEEGPWLEALSARINDLIINDWEKLIFILYRLDVSEDKLRILLRSNPSEDAGKIIANLVIERQLQKIKTREQYRQDKPSGEAERW